MAGTTILAVATLIATVSLALLTAWYSKSTAQLVELTASRNRVELAGRPGLSLCSNYREDGGQEIWVRVLNSAPWPAYDLQIAISLRPIATSGLQVGPTLYVELDAIVPNEPHFFAMPTSAEHGESMLLSELELHFISLEIDITYRASPDAEPIQRSWTPLLLGHPYVAMQEPVFAALKLG